MTSLPLSRAPCGSVSPPIINLWNFSCVSMKIQHSLKLALLSEMEGTPRLPLPFLVETPPPRPPSPQETAACLGRAWLQKVGPKHPTPGLFLPPLDPSWCGGGLGGCQGSHYPGPCHSILQFTYYLQIRLNIQSQRNTKGMKKTTATQLLTLSDGYTSEHGAHL